MPDILHFYKNGNQSFPSKSEIAVAERPGKQRSLLLYNWKPAGNLTWRQVANGAADNQIATMANGLKKYPHKVFLNIYHEPEDQVKTSSSSGMTTADYKAMYRHVVDELKSLGVNNAVYVWNPMGYYGWRDYLDGLYPGHDYVDWMCYDPYAKDNRQDDLADIVNRVKPNLNWPGYYEWATNKAPGKPLMLCEWGVDTISNSDPASIVSGNAEQLMKDFPMIKGFVYWNSIDKRQRPDRQHQHQGPRLRQRLPPTRQPELLQQHQHQHSTLTTDQHTTWSMVARPSRRPTAGSPAHPQPRSHQHRHAPEEVTPRRPVPPPGHVRSADLAPLGRRGRGAVVPSSEFQQHQREVPVGPSTVRCPQR